MSKKINIVNPSNKDKPVTMVVPKDTIKRLVRDVRDIHKNPLDSNGIYYRHDDENMMRGYALIIGPSDTPYAYGYYFFDIDYPADYPYRPPKVTFCTNQDRIRFHPNLYTSGKVCLSMLNTWRGEQWTSCQTISSILLTICTLFMNNPLINEPGISLSHPDVPGYNEIIEYKNIDVAILSVLEKQPCMYMPMFDMFRNVVLQQFADNRDSILKKLSTLRCNNDDHLVATRMYSLSVMLTYDKIIERFHAMSVMLYGSSNMSGGIDVSDSDKIEST